MLTAALVVLSMLVGLYLEHHLNTHESVSLQGRAFEGKGAEATRTCWEIAPKLLCRCGVGNNATSSHCRHQCYVSL